MSTEREWVTRARDTASRHRNYLKSNPNWTIEFTAKSLERSIGSVNEDLLIASWLRTHEDDIKKFEFKHHAVAWIRQKKRKLMLEE